MYDDEQVNSLAILSVMPFTGIFLTLLALIFCFFYIFRTIVAILTYIKCISITYSNI